MTAVICQYSVCFCFLFCVFCFLARVALDEDDDDAGPPSDDEEKEDVDELLKEAKRFMRRKK